MHGLLQFLWYRRREGVIAQLLLLPLWLLSLVFGCVVRLRRRRCARPGAARQAKARVISIGNVTLGGAGKTPVAILVARRLQAAGQRPAVLSRGYGRREPGKPILVSDGEQVLAGAAEAGDEPLLIARACPGIPVLVGPDRAALADEAVARFGARTLVLDDGFQHLRLRRDLDLVVVDASCPFGNGHLLPRGPLREPKSAIRGAGLAWISKTDQAEPEQVERLAAELRDLTGREPVRSAYRVVEVRDGEGERLGGAERIAGRRVLMLAGIARPQSFRRTLEAAGASVVGEALFPDHHAFSEAEVAAAAESMQRLGAEAIAVTEKDAVRLPRGGPFLIVGVESAILAGEPSLAAVL